MATNELARRYVLVIPVPREVEIRIEDRFLGLSGITKPLMGYHITVLGSFLLPEGIEPSSLAEITKVCSTIAPFEVAIGNIGAFEKPDDHTIYIGVIETEEIRALQRALWQTLEPKIAFASEGTRAWNMPDNYHPHVTLGLNLTDAEYAAFAHSGAEQGCAASFAVTSIDLVTQHADGPWQCLTSYTLGPDAKDSPCEPAY